MEIKLKNKLLIVMIVVLNAILIQALTINEIFDSENSKGINADFENSLFTFSEAEGSLYLIGNDGKIHTYSNILPATENTNSFIKLSLDGSIESLDLTASDETSIYINGAYIPLSKGSNVKYNDGRLEIISNSDSIIKTPTFSESIFDLTPKEIMYTSLNGANLKLSKDYTLKEGSLKYSFNDKQFYVPKGKISVLNDFKIDAQSKNVLLGKDVKFSGASLYASGSGFKLSFNPSVPTSSIGEVPISLSNAKNGKYFKNGDTGSDVRNIQRIVGVIPTGNYDKITEQAVIKWQTDNGLSDDGYFGEYSLERANYKYNFDLSKSSSGESFKLGDKGDEVKKIQSMLVSRGYLSSTFVNSYGKEVNSIDGDFGFRTENALKEWQIKNKLNPNGIFEEASSKKAVTLSKEIINLNMMGGSSIITNGRNGLDITMKGRGDLEIAGKKYLFEGGEFKENLRTSLESTPVSTPITIKYIYNEDNEDKELKLDLISPNNKIGSVELAHAVKILGLDVTKVVCSGGAQVGCLLVEEEYGGGIKLINQGEAQKYLLENGVHGDAWQIQSNILKQGGGVVYSREHELTAVEKAQLDEIQAKLKKDYDMLKKLRLSDEAIFNRISQTNSEAIKKMQNILSKDDISQQVAPQKGDIVSFYYPSSHYLTQAAVKGNNDQKNTHVGVIVGSNQNNLIIQGKGDAFTELKMKLGVKSDDSMYVQTYNYINKKTGYVEPLILKNNKFYTKDEKELSFDSEKEFLITTPVVSDFIGGQFNVRNLDDVLDESSYSLYGVTRPKSSQYLSELFITPDLVTTYQNHVSCNTISCTGFNFEELLRANNVRKYLDWNEALLKSSTERQIEYKIPDSKFNEFNALTAAIITKESSWGDSKRYIVESVAAATRTDKLISENPTLGYMQINTETVEKYAKEFNEKKPSVKQMYQDKDISLKYGQRYLAELVNIYSPTPGGITENQVKSIAAAYNFGKYTPRNAAVQAQLKELGYYNAKADGLWGEETERAIINFAKERKLRPVSSSTFYSKSLEESDIYDYIKEEYLKKTNKNPEYSLVPDWVGATIKTKAHSVSRYATEANEIYKTYCPTCA